MPTIVPADGVRPARLLLVGDRPGREEYAAATRGDDVCTFIGPVGEELWARLWRIARIQRRDCRVTTLVPTFNVDPPTPEEIVTYAPRLRAELQATRPSVIVTVGYHAARWFLPQFADRSGDVFHGLAFPYTYGRLTPRTALVVPLVSAAAALNQPDRYQAQLTDDIAALRRVLQGEQTAHQEQRIIPRRVGLAGYAHSATLGVDTEGTVRVPEAITLSNYHHEAVLDEVWAKPPSAFTGAAIRAADAVYIHNLKHDWQVLERLGIDCYSVADRLHCTMAMAYLLGKHQALKTLAYREFGLVMQEYADVVRPVDDARTRTALTHAYTTLVATVTAHKIHAEDCRRTRQAAKTAATRARRRSETRRPRRHESAEAPRR